MSELKFEGTQEEIEALVLGYPNDAAAEIIALQAINETYAQELRELQRENAELKAKLFEGNSREAFIAGWQACVSNDEFDGLSMEAHLDQYLQKGQIE